MVVVPCQVLSLMQKEESSFLLTSQKYSTQFGKQASPQAWLQTKKEPAPLGLAKTTGPHGRAETEQDPVGLLGMEAFQCPPFLVWREQSPASMTFPEF